MYNNGVSHKTEQSDLGKLSCICELWNIKTQYYTTILDGIYTILKWLSYVPKDKMSPLPVIKTNDPIDREIGFVPTKAPYDPR